MKECFVVMPIRTQGSPEFRHFRALYENVIKPTVELAGFRVTRADDLQQSGSITKDIILPLASADLVVADLTGLNANVFYELGVRHALRGQGTIMIMDSGDQKIPFDINAYRVIKFDSTLEGIGKLSAELTAYLKTMEKGEIETRDNLVHDWLPSLPQNVLDSSLGTNEGALREEIQKLKKRLTFFYERYGNPGDQEDIGQTPIERVMDALNEARQGNVPSTLVLAADGAAGQGDATAFLENVAKVLHLRTARPTSRQLMRLLANADSLGLDTAEGAILDHAQALYPDNEEIRMIRLQSFAHSDDPRQRERARRELLGNLQISVTDGVVKLGRPLVKVDFSSFALAMDTFHRDGMHSDALVLTGSLVEAYPDNSIILRNHARAFENVRDGVRAFEFYRRAALVPDASDISALWFGHELHNRRRNVDAAEAYTIACMKDLSDPTGFIHLADELSLALAKTQERTEPLPRELPPPIANLEVVKASLAAAVSCGTVSNELIDRARDACRRVEIDLAELMSEVAHGSWEEVGSRAGRLAMVRGIRQHLATELTLEEGSGNRSTSVD